MDDQLLNAHEVGSILGLTKARVHQLAQGREGEAPILPPEIEAISPTGRVTQRLWKRSDVLELLQLREAYPPSGRGPVRWTRDLAQA